MGETQNAQGELEIPSWLAWLFAEMEKGIEINRAEFFIFIYVLLDDGFTTVDALESAVKMPIPELKIWDVKEYEEMVKAWENSVPFLSLAEHMAEGRRKWEEFVELYFPTKEKLLQIEPYQDRQLIDELWDAFKSNSKNSVVA